MRFSETLQAHEANRIRRDSSSRRLHEARSLAGRNSYFTDPGLTVFVAGSMGRAEMGGRSEFDPFIVSVKTFTESEQTQLIRALDDLVAELKYPPLSNRDYAKVYDLGSLLRNTGSPKDDNENCFATRMLLLLESVAITNSTTYEQVRDQVLGQYFRDVRGKAAYRPLFLLNDIMRYWRTFWLNYEAPRHDRERPWWKKNVNLQFSRMLTVFATVAVLTVEEVRSKGDFLPVCELTPIQRLARALDSLADEGLAAGFESFLNDYEAFLCWKERDDIGTMAGDDGFKSSVGTIADRSSDFLYDVLMHSKIPHVRRKFLVI